jgi:hypothetical protein
MFVHGSILAAARAGRVGTVEGTFRQPGNGTIEAGWRAGAGVVLEDIF